MDSLERTIDQTLAAISDTRAPAEKKWAAVLEVLTEASPSDVWESLPTADLEGDIGRATQWLRRQLAACPHAVRGIYLGLDTLNMGWPLGKNVELVICADTELTGTDRDWLFQRGNWRGQGHLIKSLRAMKREYSKRRWQAVQPDPDYTLFLGYSGIVLGHALEPATEGRDFLAIWGFHDGDLFTLARRIRGKFRLVAG